MLRPGIPPGMPPIGKGKPPGGRPAPALPSLPDILGGCEGTVQSSSNAKRPCKHAAGTLQSPATAIVHGPTPNSTMPPMRAFGTAVSSHTPSRCGPGVGCKGDAAVAAADVTAEGALPAGALITGTSQKIQALGLQSYRAAGKIRSDCIEGKLRQRRVIDLGRET